MPEVIIEKMLKSEKLGVVLLLRQVEPWNRKGVLLGFQSKINGYADAITSGEFYKVYPDLKERHIRIRVLSCFEPANDVRQLLDRFNQALMKLGIGFEIIRIEIDTPPEAKMKDGLGSLLRKLRGKE